jgi:uncharacterized protein YlxW (UPF0749 family)
MKAPSWPRLRLSRFSRGTVLAAVLLGLLGFSLVTQLHQNEGNNLSTLSQSDLVRLLDSVSQANDRLDAETRSLQRTSAQLRSGHDQAAAAQEAARSRLEVLGILAGTEPAAGPGITLRVDDPQVLVQAAELLDTVEELRDAGAEAIQIGDPTHQVRVVASTALTDSAGPGVTPGTIVDGTLLRPPYTLTAIGDPATLSAALNIPGGVLETLRQAGARGTVRTADDLAVSAVRPLTTPRYATPS